MIELHNVIKTFKNAAGEFTVLKGINLTLNTGEFIAIVGKSSSGKSTLLNMITGIDHPSAGNVSINGTNIYAMTESQRSLWRGKNLGIVFQFFQLLPTLTAVENILLAMDYAGTIPRKERPERAMHILEQMGMVDHAHSFSGKLSGGQLQVIAIARSLANDPPIITADEPTGNLDSQTANSIFDLFEKMSEGGKTILMVTHDKELASRAKRTILLRDGKIVDNHTNRH